MGKVLGKEECAKRAAATSSRESNRSGWQLAVHQRLISATVLKARFVIRSVTLTTHKCSGGASGTSNVRARGPRLGARWIVFETQRSAATRTKRTAVAAAARGGTTLRCT